MKKTKMLLNNGVNRKIKTFIITLCIAISTAATVSGSGRARPGPGQRYKPCESTNPLVVTPNLYSGIQSVLARSLHSFYLNVHNSNDCDVICRVVVTQNGETLASINVPVALPANGDALVEVPVRFPLDSGLKSLDFVVSWNSADGRVFSDPLTLIYFPSIPDEFPPAFDRLVYGFDSDRSAGLLYSVKTSFPFSIDTNPVYLTLSAIHVAISAYSNTTLEEVHACNYQTSDMFSMYSCYSECYSPAIPISHRGMTGLCLSRWNMVEVDLTDALHLLDIAILNVPDNIEALFWKSEINYWKRSYSARDAEIAKCAATTQSHPNERTKMYEGICGSRQAFLNNYQSQTPWRRTLIDSLNYGAPEPYVYYSMGFSYILDRDWPSCIAMMDEAISRDSGFAHAYYLRGLCWKENKRTDRMMLDFDRFLKIAPRHPDSSIARSLLRAGDGKTYMDTLCEDSFMEAFCNDAPTCDGENCTACPAYRTQHPIPVDSATDRMSCYQGLIDGIGQIPPGDFPGIVAGCKACYAGDSVPCSFYEQWFSAVLMANSLQECLNNITNPYPVGNPAFNPIATDGCHAGCWSRLGW